LKLTNPLRFLAFLLNLTPNESLRLRFLALLLLAETVFNLQNLIVQSDLEDEERVINPTIIGCLLLPVTVFLQEFGDFGVGEDLVWVFFPLG
jgi:hypothetical protein